MRIISASAGSGKTYTLAYEYVKSVVRDPSLYRRILAVTFTNKATEEMRGRILERLHELAAGEASPYLERLEAELAPLTGTQIRARAREAQRSILHDYSRFAVLTIDRFFQRLIRSFIRELGIDPGFSLELETDSLLSLAADALVDDSAANEELRGRLFAAARERIDEGKRWDIKEPLMALGRELFGEQYHRAREGACEGETSTLIEAVVRRAGEVRRDMSAAARQMLRTIQGLGLGANDFRGKSKGLVSYLTKVAGGAFLPLSGYARQELESEGLHPELKAALTEIDALYTSNCRMVESAALLRENHRNFLLLADLQSRVEKICAEENIMPISETNRVIARLVAGNDTPFIFEKAGSYFTRYMIDEFQDTSSSQWENFVPLLRDAISSEPGEPVMLIGDVKQAIYRWRGGDWQILSRRVREQMGEGRVETRTLDVNYRSMRRVVEFNNMAVGLVAGACNDSLNRLVAEGAARGDISAAEAASLIDMLAEAYEGHTQRAADDADEGYVTFTLYDADECGDHIPPVVEKIEELQSRGYRAGDIAVLVRTNDQAARVAQMLLERKHARPDGPYCYDVTTQDALRVGASPAARFIIACLSLAADGGDVIQRAVYNRWLGREFPSPLDADEALFFSRLAALSPEEAFEEIVLRFGLQHHSADVAYIQAVHQQIVGLSSRRVADIPLFLKWWNESGARASITMQGDGRGPSGRGAITVSTIHKAKGLQYKAVVVPYLSWAMGPDTRGRKVVVWAEAAGPELDGAGALPINFKEKMSASLFAPGYYREQVLARIDAMNMLYVAVTRAEQELHLMAPTASPAGKNSIGTIMARVLGVEGQIGEVVRVGRPVGPVSGPEAPDGAGGCALSNYPTARPGPNVKLRLPSARYFEDRDPQETTLSPRDLGVAMHRAFENASGADDVHAAMSRMLSDGFVSRAEFDRLQQIVGRAFSDPLVAEWFDGGWSEVRNENNIVVPGEPSLRRPDRVMVRDGRAVAVDYKFGHRQPPEHARQLRGYMSLLAAMGYADVEGYLWYVSLGKIVPVSPQKASITST